MHHFFILDFFNLYILKQNQVSLLQIQNVDNTCIDDRGLKDMSH